MPKNIVICCDGTSNQPAHDMTNVVRLYFVLSSNAGQVSYYKPGLGSMAPPGALSSIAKKWARTKGLAFGSGLADDIRDAYLFLAQNFEPDDSVFLFGFSRGAYTVRAVAALVHMYGLVGRGNGPLIPYAVEMLSGVSSRSEDDAKKAFRLAKRFESTFSRPCPIHFVGIWDTVSSVGWFANPLKIPYSADNPSIAIGRHAVSIDERRAFFRSNLWRPTPDGGPRDVKQVWFPGSHCDVGGGYQETESAQSKYALEWMIAEARAHGLSVDQAKVDLMLGRTDKRYAAPGCHQKLHDELKGPWRLAEFVRKPHWNWKTGREEWRRNLFRRRTVPAGALVHESAYLRGADYLRRLPDDIVRVPRPSP